MHKRRGRYSAVGLVGWLFVSVITVRPVGAVYFDDARTIFFTGSFYSQVRYRTENPRGFNVKVPDWTLMQHRNFLDPQLQVNVTPWINNVPITASLADALGIDDARFFFNPRFEYEGVWDYGPDAYRDRTAPRLQKTLRIRLHEAYGVFELLNGRLNVKAGRQNLSWGETESFRLLDRINPLDNRFGGNLVSLDERRLPLTMVRAVLGLGDYPTWEIYNTAIEAFIAPDKTLPAGVPGTTPLGVIGAPSPKGFPPTQVRSLAEIGRPRGPNQLDRPDINLGDSRWGVRLLWDWQDISFTLAHLSTYPDGATPVLRLNRQGDPITKNLFPNIQVTGMTASAPLPEPFSLTVLRTEVAGFFGEPFFIEKKNFLLGVPAPKRNVIRGVIGIDHNQWIRSLNPTSTFSATGQFFYTNIQGSMRGIKVPLQSRGGHFIDVDRENFLNTFSINTLYGSNYFFNLAQIQPQAAFQYDWEGGMLIQPSVQFIRDPFRFRIEYNYLDGRFIGLGLLQDKDNLALRVDVLF